MSFKDDTGYMIDHLIESKRFDVDIYSVDLYTFTSSCSVDGEGEVDAEGDLSISCNVENYQEEIVGMLDTSTLIEALRSRGYTIEED